MFFFRMHNLATWQGKSLGAICRLVAHSFLSCFFAVEVSGLFRVWNSVTYHVSLLPNYYFTRTVTRCWPVPERFYIIWESPPPPPPPPILQHTFIYIYFYEHLINDDCFYVALFSALEQTHCAFLACYSKWVSVTFYSPFLISPFLISTEVVNGQCCLVVTWLVPRETALSALYNHAPSQVISCKTK